MMKKVLTLGAGKVGRLIAAEMSKTTSVTSVDVSEHNLAILKSLNPNIELLKKDVSSLTPSFYSSFDLVISGVPGFMGYKTLESIIKAKKNVVDISFLPEDPFKLTDLAKSQNIVAITDAGLAPGLSNLICGHLTKKMNPSLLKILVGGVPKYRKWPFEYKAPFSFVDVMEEYTRVARMKIFGNIVNKEALSEVENVDSPIGSLEAFNTDGVRSLLYTLPEVPTIIEKTLRYPGYAKYINVLKQSGFFNTEPVEYKGVKISPMEFTSLILDKEFYQSPTDEDIVVLQVIGQSEQETIQFELFDRFCKETGYSAMARTTGYTAAACANLVLDGKLNPGLHVLEHLGKNDAIFDYIIKYIKDRNVIVTSSST